MSPIIEISNLGKKYTLVHDKVPYRTLRDAITNFAKNPFARKQQRETFWALKNINLNINKGDIVGIIGKNGAGKSTLLKILSGITKPTEGKVKLYGRVSSLLEVGTGFHPELTGRENIFMNGVILGMTRAEVAKKFDEIVAFAGIEKFLDTPVKHYSSGMYVRLAFAVAAHLEPDILIVDEVLAVGDAEFQKKCLGKMGEISKEEGRTVLFVSHDMHSIMSLAKSCIQLSNGFIKMKGSTNDVVNDYLSTNRNTVRIYKAEISDTTPKIISVSMHTSDIGNVQRCKQRLRVEFKLSTPFPIKIAWLSFQIINSSGIPYAHIWTNSRETNFCKNIGEYILICNIESLKLYKGHYSLKVYFSEPPGGRVFDVIESICPFEVTMFGVEREFPWSKDTCTYLEDADWRSNINT